MIKFSSLSIFQDGLFYKLVIQKGFLVSLRCDLQQVLLCSSGCLTLLSARIIGVSQHLRPTCSFKLGASSVLVEEKSYSETPDAFYIVFLTGNCGRSLPK